MDKMNSLRPEYRDANFGEDFIREVEESGDVEGTFEKYLRKGLRYPGTNKVYLKAYLMRVLEEARRKGRL